MVGSALGDRIAADRHLTRAGALVERTGVAMSGSLLAIARGYVLACRDEPDEVERQLERGLDLHDRAGQAFGRPFALWCLGHLAARAGECTLAARHHAEALQDALRRGDSDGVACALEGLAAVCAADGRPELGVRLLGAAAARRVRMGAPSPLLSREAAAAAEVALRRAVPAERFAAAHAEGTRMDDAAVADLARVTADT
jgi:hypothetical protein